MNILGANWKTTVSGIGAAIFALLSMLAVAPQELGSVADLIPVAWKPKFFLVCALASALLKMWNSVQQKDKNVTGGTVQQDQNGDPAIPQRSTPPPPRPAISGPICIALCGMFLLGGCANMTPQQQATLVTAENLANMAGTAVATYYGGEAAGQLASAGLSAVATVLQGYVGHNVPAAVVAAAPGIEGVAQAILRREVTNGTISQSLVNKLHTAAAIAADLTASDVSHTTP